MPLTNDSREFIESLNANKVDFLVVGAVAVSWHGFSRYSADIDFLIRPGGENANRLIASLNQFGFASLGLTPDDLATADSVIQLGVEPNRIDLMTSISGVTFEEAWLSRISTELDGVKVNFIGRHELIRNKRASGRAKDLVDIEELTRPPSE